MKRRIPSNNTAFLDFLFLLMLFFAILYAVVVQHMNPVKQMQKVDMKAEFIVKIEWPTEMPDDVDLHVEDPKRNFVFFGKRESGIIHLDRDDLGHGNRDYVTKSDGTIVFNPNQEIVAVRGILPGEYIVNIHMFTKKGPHEVPVMIKLSKINPYSDIETVEIVLKFNGEERTAFRFIVDQEGEVVEINRLPISLIERHKQQAFHDEEYFDEEDD